ncbi:MAG: TrbI/VirB10 family protein [Bdellovibrionaceae bacterium]|nr:TrbI/VirB10 family protein [Pseudobdellovibrionaceae bacterium]
MKESFAERIKSMAFKEKAYFLSRREINWSSLGKCGALALVIGIVGILLLPAPKEEVGDFHQQAAAGESSPSVSSDPTEETIHQLGGGGYSRSVPSNLEHLYAPTAGVGSSSQGGNERDSSMILARGGLDSKTQIPPGSRISVKLYERAIVANQGMPVIGLVTKDYIHEDTVAIPQGSKLFGDVSFDDGGDRANVSWKSVQLPDGRERPLSAIGVGTDGQVGVSGRVHSEALKNTVGQTLTRFIGAYAEGSMQRGALGGNPGGNDNGWKNAIAETAKDRAENWANDLKKEKRWIELSNQTEFYAVLTATFAFRDPGTSYGR